MADGVLELKSNCLHGYILQVSSGEEGVNVKFSFLFLEFEFSILVFFFSFLK